MLMPGSREAFPLAYQSRLPSLPQNHKQSSRLKPLLRDLGF